MGKNKLARFAENLTYEHLIQPTFQELVKEGLAQRGRWNVMLFKREAPLILELGGHLLTPAGRLLAMKGVLPAEEIAALPSGWRVLATHPLQVPGLGGERHLVEVGRSPDGGMTR